MRRRHGVSLGRVGRGTRQSLRLVITILRRLSVVQGIVRTERKLNIVSEFVVRRGGDKAAKMFVAGVFQGLARCSEKQFVARANGWVRHKFQLGVRIGGSGRATGFLVTGGGRERRESASKG